LSFSLAIATLLAVRKLIRKMNFIGTCVVVRRSYTTKQVPVAKTLLPMKSNQSSADPNKKGDGFRPLEVVRSMFSN
jgi:hypothetical protein